ncbi:A/G-specific adenine glycosylase [Friedmanniella endophytica]|uniref:Adenine DNA glycosylase n=1 Tax=Microlunatus kandeliicorticis TaxID=1759536 RepID=A0A7W3IPA6_9ACTN|nr:A/G-specific adenine glycosylase [Microlunatus kandeliicorticis]MBA8792737.1 A/G-specific adenine glycosylase [Microlunatus kandeliicorticis]
MDRSTVVRRVVRWYDQEARDLPWRHRDATPWMIMVSEFMLQQTPVERVRGPWASWVERWPTPTALADAPAGEAVRAWGRLGYPRRALRLHQAATAIRDHHDGQVPRGIDDLLALPGVGSYTAAAIASFAFRQRHLVLDTNVRRVLSRVAQGRAHPDPTPTRAERDLAVEFLPTRPERAARWAVASMELGALVCTARSPRCEACPVTSACVWYAEGRPAWDGPPRRGQGYDGTDRQCRGALLAVLRSSDEPVTDADLEAAWPEASQRDRCLASLVADGLVVPAGDALWSLPR